MNKKFKIKIIGDCPRSLILTLALLRLDFKIYFYDLASVSKLNKSDDIYTFTNKTIKILKDFHIWQKLEEYVYEFNSISLRQNEIANEFVYRIKNSKNDNYETNIGWSIKYSTFKKILINEFMSNDNFYLKSYNQKNIDSLKYDFEFKFDLFDYSKNNFFNYSTIYKNNKQALVFNVFLRGNIDKRLYEIYTSEGLILLKPYSENIYQIYWSDNFIKSKKRLFSSKSLILDNLTTLLPEDLKVDQIIDDIKYFKVSYPPFPYSISNKGIQIYENMEDSYFTSHINDKIVSLFFEKLFEISKLNLNNIKRINIPFTFILNLFILRLFVSQNVYLSKLRKFIFTFLIKRKYFKELISKYIYKFII